MIISTLIMVFIFVVSSCTYYENKSVCGDTSDEPCGKSDQVSKGQIGYWSFNTIVHGSLPNTATAPDLSGSGYDARVFGARTTPGKIGNALSLDGLDDYDRLVIDSFEVNSSLADGLHNVFLVTGVERVWARPILVPASNPDSLTKPDQIGYLGYISEFEAARPDLNSQEACEAFVNGTLKRLYSRPGFETTFKTIGHVPPYIPGEFIRIEDDPTGIVSETLVNKFRVTRIEQNYNAGANEWTTSIGGFQVTPAVSNTTST